MYMWSMHKSIKSTYIINLINSLKRRKYFKTFLGLSSLHAVKPVMSKLTKCLVAINHVLFEFKHDYFYQQRILHVVYHLNKLIKQCPFQIDMCQFKLDNMEVVITPVPLKQYVCDNYAHRHLNESQSKSPIDMFTLFKYICDTY